MNLFATLNEVLNADVVSRIAAYIDEPVEKTKRAVDGLVYTIVGGLMKRTTSEIGVNQLYNHIQKGRFDGSLTDNLATALRDPALTNTLVSQGDEVISHLLPAMKSSIGSMISGYAGIRNSSAIALLGLTSTVVMHVLGKQVKDRKLDADGLAASLFGEREAFVAAVPDELMPRLIEKIGLQQVVNGLAAPARRTAVESPGRSVAGSVNTVGRPPVSYEPVDDSENASESLTKWGIGGLVVVALAIFGYYLYQNTQKHNTATEPISDVSGVSGDSIQADTVARSLAVPVDSTTKPKPTATPIATTMVASVSATPATTAGGLTQQMTPYLGNVALPKGKVFQLSGVAFLPGSLSMTAGSAATIGELTTLLKTYPRLQVQLVGYANDASGAFTNKSLSFKRVNLVKQQLMSSGIDFVRIDAIGRGTGVPKSDTSGIARPTLRKIDVKVVVK